jgi:type III pantothenate kinase
MMLVIDVGNTNTVLGVFKEKDLIQNWRISTNKNQTMDEYGILITTLTHSSRISPRTIQDIIISCVVPPMETMLVDLCEKYFHVKPLVVGPGIKTGMPIRYDNPREVGADRIVNAVAALDQYGGNMIIVDFGTATTFDYISPSGEYEGGAIAPGIVISSEALFQRASKLPRVDLQRPPRVVGKDTVSSMQSGIIYGYAGLVDGIVARMKAETNTNPKVIATGGQAPLIAEITKSIEEVNPFLTLHGLRIIYERNT